MTGFLARIGSFARAAGSPASAGLLLLLASCSADGPDANGTSPSDSSQGSGTAATEAATGGPPQASVAAADGGDEASGADETVSPPPVRYSCENGTAVIAQYVESDTGEQHVNLEIAGREIGLALVRSASGAKYETDAGLTPGRKLAWWTKGDGAMLIEADSGDTDGSTEAVVNCQQVAPAQ